MDRHLSLSAILNGTLTWMIRVNFATAVSFKQSTISHRIIQFVGRALELDHSMSNCDSLRYRIVPAIARPEWNGLVVYLGPPSRTVRFTYACSVGVQLFGDGTTAVLGLRCSVRMLLFSQDAAVGWGDSCWARGQLMGEGTAVGWGESCWVREQLFGEGTDVGWGNRCWVKGQLLG